MNLGLKLVGMIRQKGGVDYIPAIRNEQDFRNVDREEWLRLFEAILEKSIYAVSYTHLDVYKRQAIYRGTSE